MNLSANLPFEGRLVARRKDPTSPLEWGIITTCAVSGVTKFEEIPRDVARRLARWVATEDDIRHTYKWGDTGIGREARWFVDRHMDSGVSEYETYPEAARRCAEWMQLEAERLEKKAAEEVKEMREKALHLEQMAFSRSLKGG